MSSVATRSATIYRDLHDLGYFTPELLIRPAYKRNPVTDTTAGAAPDVPAVGTHNTRREQ